jgi:hypothetical protein
VTKLTVPVSKTVDPGVLALGFALGQSRPHHQAAGRVRPFLAFEPGPSRHASDPVIGV